MGQVGISSNEVRIHCEVSLHPLFNVQVTGRVGLISFQGLSFHDLSPHIQILILEGCLH